MVIQEMILRATEESNLENNRGCCEVRRLLQLLVRESEKISMKVKVKLLSCIRLCDPMDCRLTDSSVHGIFQAQVLEWGAISFSRRSSRPRDWAWVSLILCRRFTIWATREAQASKIRREQMNELHGYLTELCFNLSEQ